MATLNPSDWSDLQEIAWHAAWLVPLCIVTTLLLIRYVSRDDGQPEAIPASSDPVIALDVYRANFRKVVRRAQACWTGFAILAVKEAHNLYLIGTADDDPGFVTVYSFPVIFALMLGWFPFWSFMLARWVRHFNVALCPFCREPMWGNPINDLLQTVLLKRCARCHVDILREC
jgi:hypothetical protein